MMPPPPPALPRFAEYGALHTLHTRTKSVHPPLSPFSAANARVAARAGIGCGIHSATKLLGLPSMCARDSRKCPMIGRRRPSTKQNKTQPNTELMSLYTAPPSHKGKAWTKRNTDRPSIAMRASRPAKQAKRPLLTLWGRSPNLRCGRSRSRDGFVFDETSSVGHKHKSTGTTNTYTAGGPGRAGPAGEGGA